MGCWFNDECQWICSLSYILLPACCCAINSSSSYREIHKTLQENTRGKSGDDVWQAFWRRDLRPSKTSFCSRLYCTSRCLWMSHTEQLLALSEGQALTSEEGMECLLFSWVFMARDATWIQVKYKFFSLGLIHQEKEYFSGISRIFSVFWLSFWLWKKSTIVWVPTWVLPLN